jgi:uncharacterized protein with FMN-binding domain
MINLKIFGGCIMKRIITIALVLTLVAGSIFAQNLRRGNHDGTGICPGCPYEAENNSQAKEMTVRVTVDGSGRITRIVVRSHGDTDAYMTAVQGQIIPAMIEKQSADVDVIATATHSSNGIKAAVRDALNKAR